MAWPIGFCLIRQPSAAPIVCFSPNCFPRRLIRKVESLSANDLNISSTIGKASLIHNKIQINRTSPPLPDRADNRVAKERNKNVGGASRKNRAAAVRTVAGKMAAASKVDDKTVYVRTERRRE